MAGGLEFFVDGAGFDDLPNINSVMFEPTQTDPNLFAGPALNSKYSQNFTLALKNLAKLLVKSMQNSIYAYNFLKIHLLFL